VFKNVPRRRIHTCSDRAATAKLAKTTIESAFVCKRMQAVEKISGRNKITLVWIPGHHGIPGNEEAENLAKEETNKFPAD
jgi:ribonuclease HI